ncbi:EF hand calcium-binding family protein [Tripterygium wilfordii]|uniref:EF hand calcium-binding family protein n=1 Tax=Tripterygium wilfordii TaxID=458696 RepID=A0A7J7D2J5_TRIWF|nr:probable calcium-binding protein CML29 [Tripterygium wilfordii]KAF5740286.1 EF hand calcium-binding family protein [Tripterygium wilfordii]
MAQLGSLSAETETLSYALSLIEAFRAFDSDNDGSITAAELGGVLASLGYNASEEDTGAMMQQGDKNKDGLLSIEEFLEMNTRDLEHGGLASLLRDAFEHLDLNNDQSVTAEELCQNMENMGLELSLEDCQSIIASMDADGDGAASLEDLKLILNSLL